MAQLVTVQAVCDPHEAQGTTKPGETFVVGIDGKTYALECCDQHNAKLLDPIRELVAKHGRLLENNPKLMRQALKTDAATVHQHPTARKTPKPVKAAAPAEIEPVTIEGPNLATAKSRPGRPGIKTDKPRRNFCLWCPDASYTSTTALLSHLATKHGLPDNMADAFGLVCPLCGSDGSPKLGMHLMRRHKGLTVTEAFKLAMDRGDRHGVAGPVYAKVTV